MIAIGEEAYAEAEATASIDLQQGRHALSSVTPFTNIV